MPTDFVNPASIAQDPAFTAHYAQTISGIWTPTLTGMAIGSGGNARNDGYYLYTGTTTVGLLHCKGQILFGTAGATLPGAGGDIRVSLPPGYTVKDIITHPTLGVGIDDTPAGWAIARGGTISAMLVRFDSTTTARFLAEIVSGTYLDGGAVTSATQPIVWAVGNSISYNFVVPVNKT